jgi:cytoplasmic iron level regulating protein YaaA (DUF328/UPF0246 family)
VLILLPPSEGKTVPRRGRPLDPAGLGFAGLQHAREEVLDALVELCRGDEATAARTLGLGPTQLEEVRRNAGLRDAPTARADGIYSGVLYDHLDLASLDPAARRRATRRLAITSSLFGLVGPGDRIPSYRLSGDVTLPRVGTVAAHWRGVLGDAVREALGPGLLVDLRSSTYAAFWRPPADLAPRVATVRVLQQVGTRRMVVSHFNKATKGRLVRALLVEGETPRTPTGLAEVIADLGWKVELGEPGRAGQGLDVVVEDL